MEGALLYFQCTKHECKQMSRRTVHSGLVIEDKLILTQAGPILSHLLLYHSESFNLKDHMLQIRSYNKVNLKQLNVKPWIIRPSPEKTHYLCKPLIKGTVYINENLGKSIYRTMKGTAEIMLDCEDKNINRKDCVQLFSQFIILDKENGELGSINVPQSTLYPGLKVVAITSPFSSLTMYNSWSTGRICNLVDENLAVADIKLVHSSPGSPVFRYKKGNKEGLIGLVISNILHNNMELTGFSFIALVPIISTIFPRSNISITKSLDTTYIHSDESIVKIITNNNWGSGVIISENGLVITSAHVVSFGEHNETIKIKIFDQFYISEILFCTKRSVPFQLAILEITEKDENFSLKSIPFCTKQPLINENIDAVGYNLLYNTYQPMVCHGLIRTKSDYYFTTTCLIHCGCSGGAVINKKGQLIGIINANLKGDFIFPYVNIVLSVFPFVEDILTLIKEKNCQPLTEKINSLPKDAVKLQLEAIFMAEKYDAARSKL